VSTEVATAAGGWTNEIAAAYSKRLNAWHEQGQRLATKGNSTVWETADWLLEAASFDSREGWCYKEAAVILSLSVGTCRNYACVAKAFPPHRRVTSEVTTFAHHRAVVGLPEPEQERLLAAAAANRWTVGELGSEARKANGVKRKVSSTQELDKWWRALTQATSAPQLAEAWVELQRAKLTKPPHEVARHFRLMGARLITLAEQIETLPPPSAAAEPAPLAGPTSVTEYADNYKDETAVQEQEMVAV
jgi:hypothetical protein